MNYIVVYPGRFHPWHKGHKASYDYLVNKFGQQNVYVVTSDVQAPLTNPFSFQDKEVMMTKSGVPTDKIVKVKNPYQAQELTKDIPNPEDTALIFAVSAKDMATDSPRFKFGIKKNGEPSYMQPMPDNMKLIKPLTQHAYVMITPTVNFKVKGKDANSASEIRKMYVNGSEENRKEIITDLYGEPDATLKDIFDRRLLPIKTTKDIIYKAQPIDGGVLPQMKETRVKTAKLLESIQILERKAAEAYQSINEDLAENYIDEKNYRL
jgi:hypothetical protein